MCLVMFLFFLGGWVGGCNMAFLFLDGGGGRTGLIAISSNSRRIKLPW